VSAADHSLCALSWVCGRCDAPAEDDPSGDIVCAVSLSLQQGSLVSKPVLLVL
jgi:hypothetical protein